MRSLMIYLPDYDIGNGTAVVENTIKYSGSAETGYANESNSALDIGTTIISDVLLFFLVFGMSATVDIKSMRHQMRNYKALGCGLFLQFVILPFLGFITVKVFDITQVSGITLLVIVSSPGGSYSNWWCSLFNAELALSIAMTTMSTLLSIAFLPFNLYVYSLAAYGAGDAVQSINFLALLISIAIVIGAVTCGLLVSAKIKHPKVHKLANLGGNVSGILLIVFSIIIAIVGGGDDSNDPIMHDKEMYWSTALPCLLGLILANIFTTALKLDKPERVTCSVECCYQNTGIATAVAISMFQGNDLSEAVKVPLWYGVVEAVLLGIYLILAWKLGYTKAPPNEQFWTVISKSYEVKEEQDLLYSREDENCSKGDKNSDLTHKDVDVEIAPKKDCNNECKDDNDTNNDEKTTDLAQSQSKDVSNHTNNKGESEDEDITNLEKVENKT